MGCGCRGGRGVAAKPGQIVGYYVILRDGTEIPKISAGEQPFRSSFEARVEVRRAGGGTIRALKR
jgi:hypothetical protein